MTQAATKGWGVRAVLVVGLVGVVALVGWIGLSLTSEAAGPDQLEIVASRDTVVVNASEPRRHAQALWALSSDGQAIFQVAADTADATVIAVFYCNARFATAFDSAGNALVAEIGGDESACGVATDGIWGDRAFQKFTVPGVSTIAGRPIVDWTASGGGERIARTPVLQGISGYGSQIDGAFPLVSGSTYRVGLSDTDAEQVSSYSPASLEDGTVDLAPGQMVLTSDGAAETLAVEWQLFVPSVLVDDELVAFDMPQTEMRWTDPSGRRGADLAILLAGVLLGIVAAVVVEAMIAAFKWGWARAGTR